MSVGKRLFAAVASVGLLTGAPAPAQPQKSPVASAEELVALFKEICMAPGASAASAQAVFDRRNWTGRIRQRPTAAAPFTHWEFPFGDVNTGYRVIGGVEQRIDSCSIAIKEAAAPDTGALREALGAAFGKTSFREVPQMRGFSYEARLTDRPNAQARIALRGDQVPFAGAGHISLGRGILLDYSHASGRHARLMEQ